jgi:hypothetical protein
MGNTLQRGVLFTPEQTNKLFSLVRGKSSLAKLSGSEPMPFNGEKVFTFNLDSEVNLVGESAAKANGGGTVASVSMVPVKIEYGMRVSDEFKYGAEELQLQYLTAFADGFAKKVARGLDIMAMHGVNPRTGSSADLLTGKSFDAVVTNKVEFDEANVNANVETAIGMIEAAEHDVTGMAMAPAMKNALAQLKKGSTSYEPLYPELGWGAVPGQLNGLPIDSNSTVSFGSNVDRAIVGNFQDYFRWGFSKNIPIEVIEYGDPDNAGSDLKGHNEIYLRGEAYIGWGILVPAAFARICDEDPASV